MLKHSQDAILKKLSEDTVLQAFFKEQTGLRFSVTTNPNEVVPPAGFLALAGAEIYRSSNSSEASFTLVLLLPIFKSAEKCLEAVDQVLVSLFNIKSGAGIVTSVVVGDMVPPADEETTWTVPLTVVMMI